MKSASAVIGAAYGDEGKGLFTDFLASQVDNPLVIRFNGGGQSSHTVVTPNYRHIFGHIGAGSLAGADTFLSEFFICNPIIFRKEYEELKKKIGKIPKIYVDKNCLMTTPFDMIINQLLEIKRDNDRHSSCGIGFGETIERSQYSQFTLRPAIYRIKEILANIFDTYVPFRFGILQLDFDEFEKSDFSKNIENIIQHYLEDVEYFLDHVIITDCDQLKSKFNRFVFEGAQGLGLDMVLGDFPYVTRSHTGLINILYLKDQLKINRLDIYHIFRTYLTRHGNGRLDNEVPESFFNIDEKTNKDNEWQGKFRYGVLDLNYLEYLIGSDLFLVDNKLDKVKLNIGVTYMDQVADILLVENNEIIKIKKYEFIDKLKSKFKDSNLYFSYGNQRTDIKKGWINQ